MEEKALTMIVKGFENDGSTRLSFRDTISLGEIRARLVPDMWHSKPEKRKQTSSNYLLARRRQRGRISGIRLTIGLAYA